MEDLGHRVAVIGGGYAGMAAAATLASANLPVTVFEAAAVVGGRARRIQTHGRELDNGQHILLGAYRELLRLMQLVGVPPDAVLRMPLELRYADGFALRSLWLPPPFGLLGGLLAARKVSFRERVGAIRFLQALRRCGFRVDPQLCVSRLLELHRQSGRIGDYLWRPLCVSALNTLPDRASAQVFVNVLRDSLANADDASDLLLPRVDLSRLFPEHAAGYVRSHAGEVRTGVTVEGIGPGLRVAGERFTQVVLAVGPHQLKRFAGILAEEPAYEYQPIYTCYLQYPPKTKLAIPMLGLNEGLAQWVFDRGALGGSPGLLACVISAEGPHQKLPHAELAAACHEQLASRLKLPAPQWTQVVAEKRATPACPPGIRRAPKTRVPGVHLAGDYMDPEYPPVLEAAARSGVRAARAILDSHSS